MTSKTLTLDITCPDWCDESPAQHFDDGALYHKHTLGKVAATLGQDPASGDDIATRVEVMFERFDTVSADGVAPGPVVIRLGGDAHYPAEAAREPATLAATADVIDATAGADDRTRQVLAEHAAVAEDGLSTAVDSSASSAEYGRS